MKLPAVYIYKRTSDKGQELKYSMRSLSNIKNWDGSVFVSGDSEDWFSTEITVIEDFERSHDKYIDARNRLKAITQHKNMPEVFIFLNDDFYITKPIEVKPLYDGRLLSDGDSKNVWQVAKDDTRTFLQEQGIKVPLNYAIHVPMVLEKEKLANVINIIESNPDRRLMMRSLYGNLYAIGGKQYKDRKTHSDRLLDGELLSTRVFSKDLETMFPHKSKFEA